MVDVVTMYRNRLLEECVVLWQLYQQASKVHFFSFLFVEVGPEGQEFRQHEVIPKIALVIVLVGLCAAYFLQLKRSISKVKE